MTQPNRPLFTLLSLFIALSSWLPLSKSLAAMVDASGAKYYHQDGLGSVTALSDDTGAIIETYRYDIFGTPAIYDATNQLLSASAQGNRFLFTGREWIAEANLYDYRNRVFSPVLGRFLQTDPIRFAGGDTNMVSYVFNNPVNDTDPSGLAPTKLIKWVYKGGKKLGFVPTRNISEKAAIRARRAGKDVQVSGKNKNDARQKATEIETKANGKDGQLHHGKDEHKKSGNQPHVQTDDVPGHTFYRWTGMTTITYWFGDNWFTQGLDFFNPISAVNDVAELYDDFSGDDDELDSYSDPDC
jgi:RHS repeat-associated protein